MIEALTRSLRKGGETSAGPTAPILDRIATTKPRSVPMGATSRRDFLRTASGAAAGLGTSLTLGRAPAFAQKRELTFLSWNHFVPASDDELRKQAEAFGKQAGVAVRGGACPPL